MRRASATPTTVARLCRHRPGPEASLSIPHPVPADDRYGALEQRRASLPVAVVGTRFREVWENLGQAIRLIGCGIFRCGVDVAAAATARRCGGGSDAAVRRRGGSEGGGKA